MSLEVRADLMVLQGDLAIRRGRKEEAREILSAARPLVSDAELVDERLARAGFRIATTGAVASTRGPGKGDRPALLFPAQIAELKRDFTRLLDLTSGGSTKDASTLAEALDARVSGLPEGAEKIALRRALDAIGGAVRQAKYNAAMASPDEATPAPKPPTREDLPRGLGSPLSAERELERLRQRYETELASHKEAQGRRQRVRAKAEEKLQEKLQEARKITDETFAALEGHPTPVRPISVE
jgi:hypothetical protein